MANQQTENANPQFGCFSIPTRRLVSRNKVSKCKAQLWIYNPFLLILTNLLYFPLCVGAETSPHVVRLSSATSRSCGSGVLLNAYQVLTTAHVARSLCTSTKCVRLQVTGTIKGLPIEQEFNQASIERYSEALDLAVLNLSETLTVSSPVAGAKLAIQASSEGSSVVVRGYPECGEQVTTSGEVTTRGTIQSTSSAPGKPGSSGSGVFNKAGELLGIVDQAAHLSGVLAYNLFGSSFHLKFINSPAISSILAENPTDSLVKEAEILNAFFRDEVVSTSGWRRLLLSDQFLTLADSFHQRLGRVSPSLENLRILTYLRGYPGRELHELLHVTVSTSEPITERVLLLTFATMLERNGIQAALFQPLLPSTVRALIEQSQTTHSFKTSAFDLLSRFEASRYQGFKTMFITTISSTTVLLTLILVVWAFSLGNLSRYLADVPSRFYRLWILFIVAFGFWPLSLIIFWLKEYRRNNRRRRSLLRGPLEP